MVYFSLQFIVHHQRKSGQEVEVGTKTEAMEERCLLIYSLWIALLAFLYSPGWGPGVALCIVGFTLPHQSLIKTMTCRLTCL